MSGGTAEAHSYPLPQLRMVYAATAITWQVVR